jgi:hypothetical protein
MITKDKFSQIDTNTDEGKMLLSAISVLTSIDENDIRKKRFGGMVSPNEAYESLVDLANRIFYENEYKIEKKRKRKERNRQRLINKILT